MDAEARTYWRRKQVSLLEQVLTAAGIIILAYATVRLALVLW